MVLDLECLCLCIRDACDLFLLKMGRIGRFFKKCWNGIKKGVKWVVNKGVNIGKKIVDNPIVKAGVTAAASAFGVPPSATLGVMNGVSKGLGVVQNVRDKLSGGGGTNG